MAGILRYGLSPFPDKPPKVWPVREKDTNIHCILKGQKNEQSEYDYGSVDYWELMSVFISTPGEILRA